MQNDSTLLDTSLTRCGFLECNPLVTFIMNYKLANSLVRCIPRCRASWRLIQYVLAYCTGDWERYWKEWVFELWRRKWSNCFKSDSFAQRHRLQSAIIWDNEPQGLVFCILPPMLCKCCLLWKCWLGDWGLICRVSYQLFLWLEVDDSLSCEPLRAADTRILSY